MIRSLFIVSLITIVYALSIGIQTTQAQPYPSHPIQLVIPSAPGDGTDIAARLFAEELAKILKVPVVPLNKPGASATLGTDMVVKSKKDGYTLLYANTSAVVYSRASEPDAVPYDPVKDLEPLGFHTFFPTVTACGPRHRGKISPSSLIMPRRIPRRFVMARWVRVLSITFNGR